MLGYEAYPRLIVELRTRAQFHDEPWVSLVAQHLTPQPAQVGCPLFLHVLLAWCTRAQFHDEPWVSLVAQHLTPQPAQVGCPGQLPLISTCAAGVARAQKKRGIGGSEGQERHQVGKLVGVTESCPE